jgi:dethiobiotin synthetase
MKLDKRHARDSSARGVFITATDTGVGKTLVASALVWCLTQRGIDVGVMKPIETGVSRSAKARSDGARLRRAAGNCDPMAEVSPYVFRLPVAPVSAARAEGTTVRIATIIRAFHALRQKHRLMAVEGVGGVYAPLTASLNVLDLLYQLKLPAIVVGQSGLGGINHALLTLHALRQRNIPILALVLNQRRPVHTKTARLQEQSTVTLLRRLSKVPVVGPIPYRPHVNQKWNEELVRLAGTAAITKLARLVLARMLHEGSSQNGGVARDKHEERDLREV